MYFACEYAASSIGSCKACPRAISKKSVKIGFTPDFDHGGTTWFHFSCFFKKCYYRKELKGEIQDTPPFAQWDSLETKDQERVQKAYAKLVESLNSGQTKKKGVKRQAPEDNEDQDWKPTGKDAEEEEKPNFEGYIIGDHMYMIDGLLFLKISKFKEVVLVSIREFYKPPRGKSLKPGKNGISLTVEQYCKLWSERSPIEEAVNSMKKSLEETHRGPSKRKKAKTPKKAIQKVNTEFAISTNRKICVETQLIDGENQVVIDIREYKFPERTLEKCSPTEKGITLTEEQWRKVLALHNDVIKDLSENFETIVP